MGLEGRLSERVADLFPWCPAENKRSGTMVIDITGIWVTWTCVFQRTCNRCSILMASQFKWISGTRVILLYFSQITHCDETSYWRKKCHHFEKIPSQLPSNSVWVMVHFTYFLVYIGSAANQWLQKWIILIHIWVVNRDWANDTTENGVIKGALSSQTLGQPSPVHPISVRLSLWWDPERQVSAFSTKELPWGK